MFRLAYHWRVLIVAILGYFMVILDSTIVNIALPRIMTTFNASVDRAQLVITGYLIALALVIPATGFLSDRFGTKRVFIFTVAGFTLGSVLCGLSWDIDSLIFFRVIQGLAGGMTQPLGMTLIFRAVPRHQIGFAMGIYGISIVWAPALGPTLGGYLVEYVNWRMIFYLNVPIGVLGALLAGLHLRETEKSKSLPFDYKGFILAGIGFSTALVALTYAPQDGWGAANIVALFSVSAIALSAWVVVELREKSPLLDLRILRNPTFTLVTGINFVIIVGFYAVLFLLTQFLQNVRQLGPMQTGLLFLPEQAAIMVLMPLGGRLYDKIGARPLLLAGLAAMGYATFQLHTLDLATGSTTVLQILLLRGVGLGLLAMPVITLALSLVPAAQVARASALISVLRQLMVALGLAAFVTLFQARQEFHYSNLAQTVTPDSLAAVQVLSGVEHVAAQQGIPPAMAQQTAIEVLTGLVQRQAAVTAFDDVFLILSIMILVALVPTLFLRRPKQEQEERHPTTATTSAPETAD
jgi:EmrB/QacA subfamily drug resistance transporter